MTSLGNIAHGLAAAVFVTAGVLGALQPGPGLPLAMSLRGQHLAYTYLAPDNPLMWTLLLVVWAVVALDAIGQWIDPSEGPASVRRQPRVQGLFVISLLIASAAPALLRDSPAGLAVAMCAATGAAIVASRRAAGRHRPAIGFYAGWMTAVTSAALAIMADRLMQMPVVLISATAILPATAVGIVAQIWIGPSIGYSAALIWAFCAMAITTMGTAPLIALWAIVGIASMAIVLVRAAS
ncbi:MAG: hypothetical protein ACK41U_10750 [Paracoccus sp. (in: a-proteobacteria)]|uniref:hypothetical protein n=1 Tax=Paracoccus sp. TaxID=267 RepID=UPI0039195AF3